MIMVKVNGILDLKTKDILDTARLNRQLYDLSEDHLGVIFVAQNRSFDNQAWRDNNHSYLRVVLPYHEVLISDNIDLLVYQTLYDQLDQLEWMDVDSMKFFLKMKMEDLEKSSAAS